MKQTDMTAVAHLVHCVQELVAEAREKTLPYELSVAISNADRAQSIVFNLKAMGPTFGFKPFTIPAKPQNAPEAQGTSEQA